MTWNISQTGPKADVLKLVEELATPNLAGGEPEQKAFEAVKCLVASVGAASIHENLSVSASGHDTSTTVSISKW